MRVIAAAVVVVSISAVACSGDSGNGASSPTSISTTTSTRATTTTTTTMQTTTTTTAPKGDSRISSVTAADLPSSWRPGCPVAPEHLRRLRVDYWGFDDQPHVGMLVVNASVAADVLRIFDRLRSARFPIRRMQMIEDYHGSDEESLDADNTAGFNCRAVVAAGPRRWSAHAYGTAIDVNPVENPYLEGGRVHPAGGTSYLTRSPYRAGMAVPGGELVKAFASAGWQWGGRWSGTPDYQHFSSNGS